MFKTGALQGFGLFNTPCVKIPVLVGVVVQIDSDSMVTGNTVCINAPLCARLARMHAEINIPHKKVFSHEIGKIFVAKRRTT
ncbi:MAG: hypothetical protein BGP07_13130 [Rhizobiales bacterium 63-22]|nr:MAG: hypothetical protein BGP07_13130 [Rhizobiales bacterium 63-22]